MNGYKYGGRVVHASTPERLGNSCTVFLQARASKKVLQRIVNSVSIVGEVTL